MQNPNHNRELSEVSAFILAGGFGTRARTVLGDTPKLLAPLSGRPYLDYLVAWLKRFGIRRITLGLGYQSDKIADFLSANPYRNMEINIVVEDEPLGTAGAIALAREAITGAPILVLNGDSYVSADLGLFFEFHQSGGFDSSLICTEIQDAGRYGSVEVDSHNHISCFREKDPSSNVPGFINAGVYLLGNDLLDSISILGKGSIEHDIFSKASGSMLGAYCGKFSFIDFGTPDSYKLAQPFFAELPVSEIH
jgi:NDP-sugar pyrophosphorylase family protein